MSKKDTAFVQDRKTKIICTIGPSCESVEKIEELLRAGMNVARLNMSHGSIYSHQKLLNNIKKARSDLNIPCAIMVDTCGPEIRIGTFSSGRIRLERGQTFSFYFAEIEGDEEGVALPYPALAKSVHEGQKIYACNGLLEFTATKVDKKHIECVVDVGGEISDHKSVSIKGVDLPLPFLGVRDEANLRFAVENDVEYISASFVSSKRDVLEMRDYLTSIKGKCSIISKIESETGLKNIDEILSVSDGIMVARGDLGTNIDIERVPLVQRELVEKALSTSKIVIVATEMLESMTHAPRPTRAETTDVSLAVYERVTATMLSGETSSGEYPIEACKAMSSIARIAEDNLSYGELDDFKGQRGDVLRGLCHSASFEANVLDAKAIVCFTNNGITARLIASFRPKAPIIAITHDAVTYNALSLVWGVVPKMTKSIKRVDKMIEYARALVCEMGIAEAGDEIVVTLGLPLGENYTTDTIHIMTV